MRKKKEIWFRIVMLVVTAALASGLIFVLCRYVPRASIRYTLFTLCSGFFIVAWVWNRHERRQVSEFADDLCRTLDDLIAGREIEGYHPYEDSLTAKVQGKLMQYYDLMSEGKRRSQKDKQTIQELVSDISHQVKTPVANLRMFIGILQEHRMTEEKRQEFLAMMAGQINKLDFLMQSLIKMSRLETGTFALQMENASLYDTIAQAVSGVWKKAEQKDIQIDVDCGSDVMACHDLKWTAEAFGNILDNAVKYTPEGGSIWVKVRPWQFYTRVDITDTGIGIPKEHYHDVFKRFYRAQEAAAQEGVGLGLYLAQGIVTRQRGYISVKSKAGEGTTFTVYLLSENK